MPDGKVSFYGVWTPGGTFGNMGGPLPLQAWADDLYRQRRATLSKDDPEGRCLPAGVPRISPFPSKIIQMPEVLVILEEGNVHSYRQIFLAGRGHLKNAEDLWMGDSVGSWDTNDTLVVDTIGFNDMTWLNGQGVPHTTGLHVVEKMRRPDLGRLETEITLEDPQAFTRPHTFKRAHTLMVGAELLEYVCNEFNVDAEHLVGK